MKVSRSGLIFLFADRAVQRSSLASRVTVQAAAPVPCSKGLVRLGPFEQLLVAWALWELIVDGEMDAVLGGAPRQFRIGGRPRRQVLLTPVVSRRDDGSLASSLAGEIPPEGCTAASAELGWTARRDPLPVFGVLKAVRPELVAAKVIDDSVIPPHWWHRWWGDLVMSGCCRPL